MFKENTLLVSANNNIPEIWEEITKFIFDMKLHLRGRSMKQNNLSAVSLTYVPFLKMLLNTKRALVN